MRDAKEDTITGLEALADIATAAAPVLAATAAPAAPGAALAGIMLRAIARQMRNYDKTPEEIVKAIEMPRKVDVDDFRAGIDERIRDLPEKG